MSYDRKHKLEYHLASAHNKIDSKLSQDQELVQMQQPKIEYFQEVRIHTVLYIRLIPYPYPRILNAHSLVFL